jgi:DNA replication protein DnaC
MDKKKQDLLDHYIKSLGLSSVGQQYKTLTQQAVSESLSYEEYLLNTLQQEYDERRSKRFERRLKESHLPLEKNMESFDLKRLPSKVTQQIKVMLKGGFIDHKENLLIFGTPGSGKSHLSCGIGQEMIYLDKRIYYDSCALLLQDLLLAKKNLTLPKLLKKLNRFDALIIDDIGYVQQAKEEMEVLFTLLAERYERGSVMITSNLPFSKWEKIFKDPMMTAAAVDRIVHHSVILELNIQSYRMSSAKERK